MYYMCMVAENDRKMQGKQVAVKLRNKKTR